MSELENKLKDDPRFQHILKTAPQSQRELMTFELAQYFEAYTNSKIVEALESVRNELVPEETDKAKEQLYKAVMEVIGDGKNDSTHNYNAHAEREILRIEQRQRANKLFGKEIDI